VQTAERTVTDRLRVRARTKKLRDRELVRAAGRRLLMPLTVTGVDPFA